MDCRIPFSYLGLLLGLSLSAVPLRAAEDESHLPVAKEALDYASPGSRLIRGLARAACRELSDQEWVADINAFTKAQSPRFQWPELKAEFTRYISEMKRKDVKAFRDISFSNALLAFPDAMTAMEEKAVTKSRTQLRFFANAYESQGQYLEYLFFTPEHVIFFPNELADRDEFRQRLNQIRSYARIAGLCGEPDQADAEKLVELPPRLPKARELAPNNPFIERALRAADHLAPGGKLVDVEPAPEVAGAEPDNLPPGNEEQIAANRKKRTPAGPVTVDYVVTDPEREGLPDATWAAYWATRSGKIGESVGHGVDEYFKMDELSKVRAGASKVDACLAVRKQMNANTFEEKIAFFTQTHMVDQDLANTVQTGVLGMHALYDPADPKHTKVSLISHPMCVLTKGEMEANIRKDVSDREVALANRFAFMFNVQRERALHGETQLARTEAFAKLLEMHARMLSCLGYQEGLMDADREKSVNLAASLVGSKGKHPGVNWYWDKYQDLAESRLNLGLGQFSPSPKGGVRACVLKWNELYPMCKISSDSMEAIRAELSSPQQVFNAFCVVNKIVQTYFDQVNTRAPQRTGRDNHDEPNEMLWRHPKERCVTPFIHVDAYMHYGPLMKTVKETSEMASNLDLVLSCTMNVGLPMKFKNEAEAERRAGLVPVDTSDDTASARAKQLAEGSDNSGSDEMPAVLIDRNPKRGGDGKEMVDAKDLKDPKEVKPARGGSTRKPATGKKAYSRRKRK